MKRWMLWMLVGLLLGGTLACNAVKRTQSEDIAVTVKNDSPEKVCYAFISPSTEDEWGGDQLGDEETLVAGAERTFRVPAGKYDVSVQNCAEVTLATAWEVSSDTTVVVGQAGATVRLLVDNTSEQEVCYVFITPSVESEWDVDRMGDMESLPAGAQRMFFVEPGQYDLMAANCDEETLTEEYEIDLTEDLVWTLK